MCLYSKCFVNCEIEDVHLKEPNFLLLFFLLVSERSCYGLLVVGDTEDLVADPSSTI